MPGVFERKREDLAGARARLAELTSEDEYRDLRRTTLNAHYTHARYVQLIWDALGQLGFSGGRILEPGSGSGNFIGLAPDGADMTGIERDPVTAAIAAALYPQADIRAESFADTRIRAGYFDAAVGNVPFGKFKLSDPGHNPGRRLSIHNHFIVKALALTRPGGMVALLTSRYTMDSRSPEARRQIASLADLVAAIRLPTNAHRQAAGTDVVTDLLILRRREPSPPAAPDGWELAPEVDLPGGQARVNEYFTAHPEFVLGEMRVGRGARNEHDLIVAGSPDAAPGLAAALETAVTRARESGLVMTERAEATEPAPLAPLAPQGDQIEGLIQALPDGTFTRLAVTGSDLTTLTAQTYRPPATQARELRQLLGLRDTVLALLRAEAATPDDSEEITRLRAQLNAGYGDYVARYGPVKRFSWAASGRTDPATGEKKHTKRRPSQGGFRNDPLYPLVYALEESYDPATRTAVRADIFTQRVVVPEPPLLGADTADEALAICLNSYGEVRLGEITRLLGVASDTETRAELGTLVYDEPGTGRLIWAPLYLSGDVRAKLAAATDAAASDPRFEENVRALREVIPRDLGPAEIEAQLGAGWIAHEYVQQFLHETLGDDAVTVERARGRKWKVSGGNRRSVAATSTWGTRDVCAHDLAQRLLTGTAEQILVHYKASDGTKVVDHQATEAAKQKARELADRFSIWVWEDTGRARDLSRVYNDRYNAVVPVSFDNVRLFTPGLSAALTLRKHQPPAIARIIYQGSAGLVHDTGAGKTLETIIGVCERQRLGLSHKPCFVVQKHKLGDFRDEFLRAYPGARLLVADTDDLTGNKRREFIARCATGNPAAIIMSREAFRSIPVSAERIAAFLEEEERALEQAVEDAQNSREDDRTIKQIEADLLNTRERRKEQVAKIGQDRGLCYEDTGIDYVVVDEARGYRKGPVVSSLPGMADPGSARALDLLLKLGYHKELYGETRVCLADATPFTNRISEIYTWLRYLNPDIEDFDSWVRTFGKMATAYEMTPGGDFKAKARLREIINAVDLHLWLRELNDFKLKDSLDLKLPVMTGGKPEIVQVPASDELIAYADEIAWRYEHLPKGPPKKGEDNHLKIQGDAIKSALDLRLVGRSTSQPQKADVTADVIFQKWLRHRDDVYKREDGSEHPVRGSLILVFASLGTPGRIRKLADNQEPARFGQWDFYTELRGQLIARGMPGHLIRFIHEAGNAQQKEELYRACRNGEIAVLVGSTEKLGTGTNVQDRAVGLVQVTAPWNWDEPHQELGRVERQGNQNPEFFCSRIVTSPSADAIKWERARQKEQSFRALMSGRIEGRTIRIPDDDLSSAEVMAAASGDLRLLERAELEGTISRLHTLRRAWAQNQTALGYTISSAEQQIAGKKQAIGKIDAALSRRKDTRGDTFAMTVDGQRFAKRADAAERLRELLRQHIAAIPRGHIRQHVALGEIGGFTLTATLAPQFANSIALTLEGIPDLPAPLALNHRELPEKTGIITRLENRLSGLEQVRTEAEAAIEQLTSEIEAARASIGGSFPQQDEYDQACARLDALETELVGESKRAGKAAEPGTAEITGSGPTQQPERGSHDHQPASQDYGGTGRRAPAAASSQPANPGARRAAPGRDSADADAEMGEPQPYKRARPQSHAHITRDETAGEPAAAPAPPRTDWIPAHPLAHHIDMLLREASADSLIVASASAGDSQNFAITFRSWLDRHVAAMARDGHAPGAIDLVKAYCDDPGLAADLTATLAAIIHSAHGSGTPSGGPAALAPAVVDAAARHWRKLTEKTRRDKHGCDPADGTCPACAADPHGEELLRLAAEIDVHMTRLGVLREGRRVAWDSQAGTYMVQCTAGQQQPAWQLMMPADGAVYAVFRGGQWSPAQLHLRRGEAEPAQVASAFAGMLTGPAARPAEPAPAAAAEPAHDPPSGLVIEHHQQGTLVHGTGKNDLELRRLLHEHGFRWSRTLNAWYLPRPWGFSTRDHRVTGLTASLGQAGRSFTLRDQPHTPAATVPGSAPGTDTPTAARTPEAAQPATKGPEPSAVPAVHEQTNQGGDASAHTAAPSSTPTAPSPHAPAGSAPVLPAVCRTVSDLRQLANAYSLSIDTAAGSRSTQLTVVHGNGRTVLLHDDISGTTAGGYRLDPGEVPAYLAAYAGHPLLPARPLIDLARRDPTAPGILTLTGAREIAARHGLDVRIRRAGEHAYITICEPGITGPPVLSYPAGTGCGYHGPCAVPVAAINGYLLTYRDNVPPAMFTAPAAAPQDWARRVAQLTPHLLDGGGHFIRDVRDHLRQALAAARNGNHDEADRSLYFAEHAAPPLTPTPEREAELAGVINDHTARYGWTGDPAAHMASAGIIDASDREWDWVRSYISAHPHVRERTPQDKPATTAAPPDAGRQAAAAKASQANTALENGDYEQALTLLDEAELLYPDRGVHWDAARQQVRDASNRAQAQQQADPESPDPAAGTDAKADDAGPDAAIPDRQAQAAGSAATAVQPAARGAPQPQDGTGAGQQLTGAEQARPDGPGAAPAPAPDDAATERPTANSGPDTAVHGTQPGQDPPGAADGVHPGGQGQYFSRIRISDTPGRPTVSGTSYADDPPELREALRDNGFTWRKQRKVWEYTGRDVGRQKSVTAIRELLARLDRDAAPGGGKTFPPTAQQQAILDACLQGKDVAVQALAGTGKTTTLVLIACALMERSPATRIIYTAFNADIVADARRGRFGRNVTAMTMHSIAKQALLGTSYASKITDGGQGARWPEQWAEVLGIPALTVTGGDPVPAEAVARLVIATVRRFRESADEQPGRQHLSSHLAGAAQSPLAKAVLSYARKAWADITDTGNAALLATGRALRVDHDDYLKVWALCRPRIGADVVFFDEAQDVNAVMRQVILDQPAQTIVVGDSHQSIYGFRGAIDALKDWPADVVLPLTQSWRFGPDAAEFGNLFLQSLGSGLLLEGNPALETRVGRADEPDAILCRTNASAVAEVFAGLESGKRTALAGGGQAIKDIAKAARDLQAGRGTKHPDLSRFADWDEVRAYAQQEEDGKSLQVFVRLVDRHGPDGLIDMISRLTPEGDAKNPPQLTISTAHKAKGREWDTVRIAGDFRGPATDPETGDTIWPSPEERRLAYVAATRAKELLETGSLTWIYDYPQTDRRDGQGTQRTPPLQELAASKDPRAAATPQPPPAPDTSTTATAGQPAPGPGKESPGHDAAGGSPQKPGQGTRDDAPAADDAKAGRIVAAARRRAEARDRAHVPIDYAQANAMVRRQRAALTRAVNSGDPAKVILAAQNAVSEWDQPGMAWPDDWSRWQRALDDVLPWDQRILLEDLPARPAPDDGAPRPSDTAGQLADATAETVTGPAHGKPASSGDPEPTAAPVNNGDLAAALHRLPGGEFARFVSGAGTPGPAGSRISRQDGEPDAGAHEELEWDANGINITIRARGTLRHSLVSWAQVASWIDPGMTPARLGLILEANLLNNFCRSRRAELIAAGNTDPAAAGRELSQIRDDTINTVISTALSTRGAAAPIPPARSAQPGYQTAAMIIRPGPAASKDENTALERLAQLRAVIRQMQPASNADIKTTIRRWIGDGLPDYVRALGKPAAMREWITGQVTTRAGRPGHGTYDTPGISGGLWSGASPEGLLTARDGEHRTETLTPWAEIPAWIQPGISSQCRERLLAADGRHRAIIRRQLLTAAHTLSAPGEQQDKEKEQAARMLREALDAAWAAIAVASAPTPGQCEQARRTYQEDTSPVQERLFGGTSAGRPGQEARKPAGDPAEPGQPPPVPAKTGPATQPAGRPTTPRTSNTPPAPARQQDVPAPGSGPPQAPAVPGDKAEPAAAATRPGTSSNPLARDDIFLGLRRLPVLGFAELICAMGDGQPLDSLARHLEPRSGERAADEPDTGARETVTCTPQGVRIRVAAGSGMRAGLLAWPEVADWLRPGLSAGRLQVMRQAAQTRLRLITVNASFRAVGEADLAASAELELRNLISAAVSAALEAARSASAGKPAPSGQQSPPADDGAAALERIRDLASALPAWPPQWQKPVSQVQAGDIIGHPGYKLQPFRVSAQPRHQDGVIEITGRLTRPGEGEPAGETTWTMTINGQADPPVHVVPLPARSLRPSATGRAEPAACKQGLTQDGSGGPGTEDPQRQETAAKDPDLPRSVGATGAPTAGSAPVGAPTPISGDGMGTRQPHSTASAAEEEDIMPPVLVAEPVPATRTPAAADPGPALAGPAAAREDTAETRTADVPAERADEEIRLMRQLDDVLTAIIEHRRANPQSSASADAGFADIRSAFASLRNALELPANGSEPRSGSPVAGPAPAQPPPATARHARPAPEADDFGDIRAAFTALRRALDLPAHGRHTRTPGPPDVDAASDRLLDQAAAEAQACAQWYRDTPEWQRITTISRATRDLITTIRQASGEYWAEIRQDIRVRGFVRSVAARASLAVSGASHILAGRLERSGHKDTGIWQAAWGLHRATATFADRVMRYTPPRSPDRMGEVRHIINDLRQRPRHLREPGPSRAAGSRSREAGTTSAAALGKEGFPLPVSSAAIRQAAAPAARAAAPPLPRRPYTARRR